MDIFIVLVVILIVLVFLCTAYKVARLVLRAEHAPTPTHPRLAWAEPPSRGKSGFGSPPGPAWGALDDVQLTRLLTDSAPPPTISD